MVICYLVNEKGDNHTHIAALHILAVLSDPSLFCKVLSISRHRTMST